MNWNLDSLFWISTPSSSFNASTDLAWGDVAVQIHLKMSKRDQFGDETDVIVGVTGMDIALSCR